MDAFFDSSELMVRNLDLGDGDQEDEEDDPIDPLEAPGDEIDELHDILRHD